MEQRKVSYVSDSAISMQTPGVAAKVRPLLSNDMLKRLVDKSYEKRWVAAAELQQFIQTLAQGLQFQMISDCIEFFKGDFLDSPSELNKLGGLLAYSAIALGISAHEECEDLYGKLLMPVITCFSDTDSTISFYAAETMHNIAKVLLCREHVLGVLKQMLTPLIALFASVDQKVRQAMQQLDCMLKSIVVETDADPVYLDRSGLIDIIGEKLKSVKNPNSLQMLVSWLAVLQSIPSFNLVHFLSKFLEALFLLLSAQCSEVQQTVLNALNDMLSEITARLEEPNIDLSFITKTMSKLCNSGESMVRLRALAWLNGLLAVAGTRMVPDYADLIDSVTRCLLDPHPGVVATSAVIHRRMLQYIKELAGAEHPTDDLRRMLEVLILHIEGPACSTWETLMMWLKALYSLDAAIVGPSVERIVRVLVERIAEAATVPLEPTLDALCLLSNFEGFSRQMIVLVLEVFKQNGKLMEERGGAVVISLCRNLEAERVYRTLADILLHEPDEAFSRRMVELLDILLLTEDSLSDLREIIRSCFATQGKQQIDFFEQLFITWCLNPVSSLTLCFLAQAYELAFDTLLILSKARVSVEVLTQLARLIQMFERPIFTQLRMQMLEPEKYPCLLKALYGLLMMLPQSRAYAALEGRLSAAVTLRTDPLVLDYA